MNTWPKRWWLSGIATVVVIALGVGFTLLDRATLGIAGFMVWRAVSDTAHGGQYVELNGVRLYVETFGEGEPLLLVHGGMGTIESMHNQIRAFSKDRFVIAPDSREHGRSGPVETGLHYADMADDMALLLDHLGVARADIFGWSDGGVIALDLAMRHPDRVGKLAVFGTNYHHEGVADTGDSWLDGGADSEELAPVRMLYQGVAQNPDRWPILYDKIKLMWRTEPQYTEAQLATISSPALIMVGEHDAIKPDHVQSLARAIPNARLEVIPDATHFAPMENPGAVNALLATFFSPISTFQFGQ